MNLLGGGADSVRLRDTILMLFGMLTGPGTGVRVQDQLQAAFDRLAAADRLAAHTPKQALSPRGGVVALMWRGVARMAALVRGTTHLLLGRQPWTGPCLTLPLPLCAACSKEHQHACACLRWARPAALLCASAGTAPSARCCAPLLCPAGAGRVCLSAGSA